MSNFGFSHLRVVNPYEKAFRTARSAVGAAELLASAEEYDSVGDAIADCTLVVGTTAVRHRAVQHPLRRLEYGARLIRKHMGSGPVAPLVWLGAVWPLEAGSQPLPLADSHSHSRAEHLDESRPGGCDMPL